MVCRKSSSRLIKRQIDIKRCAWRAWNFVRFVLSFPVRQSAHSSRWVSRKNRNVSPETRGKAGVQILYVYYAKFVILTLSFRPFSLACSDSPMLAHGCHSAVIWFLYGVFFLRSWFAKINWKRKEQHSNNARQHMIECALIAFDQRETGGLTQFANALRVLLCYAYFDLSRSRSPSLIHLHMCASVSSIPITTLIMTMRMYTELFFSFFCCNVYVVYMHAVRLPFKFVPCGFFFVGVAVLDLLHVNLIRFLLHYTRVINRKLHEEFVGCFFTLVIISIRFDCVRSHVRIKHKLVVLCFPRANAW